MEVLIVSHYFAPWGIGGTEDYARGLARFLLRHGHGVHVFHGIIGQPHEEHEIVEHVVDGIPCTGVEVDLREIDDFSRTWRQEEVDTIFERLLDEKKPHLVHVNHLTRLSLGMLEVLKRRRIPVILTLHDYWMQCARGVRLRPDGYVCREVDLARCAECMGGDIDYLDGRKKGLRRLALLGRRGTEARHAEVIEQRRDEMTRALEGVDLLVSVGPYLARAFKDFGVRREIRVEPGGVDPAMAGDYRETKSDVLRFGFVGRLVPQKGVETLIEAYRELDRRAELVIHGYGEEEYVRSLKDRAGSAPIRFTGRFQPGDVGRLASGFDVQVMPSVGLEGSPLLVQTARLFRKTLIASDAGGLGENVRDGIDALVFPSGDAAALRRCMQRLVDEPGLADRLRNAMPPARTEEEHYTTVLGLYQSLLAR
ncbi:MAG: glycosyltransferase [Planctomycetota bacterium]